MEEVVCRTVMIICSNLDRVLMVIVIHVDFIITDFVNKLTSHVATSK